MSLQPLQAAEAQATAPVSHLADEANHRIANHLAMLAALGRLQAKGVGRTPVALSGKDVQRLLEDFAGRLETVSEIHRLLAHRPGGAPVDMAGYLDKIAQGLVSSLAENSQTSVHCVFPDGFVLPAEQAVALGLLVGELVTNALKYSHPAGVAGAIAIEASRYDDDTIAIEVADDGVGLPEGIDPHESESLGFRTIRLLANRLGASISFDSQELGLSCILHIPYAGGALKPVS
jgi:two-component sensor histidine kinase